MLNTERIGIIISNKPNKTIIVLSQRRYLHLKYKKVILKTKHYCAHDENNDGHLGDIVLIKQISPLSCHKTWKLKQILNIYNLDNLYDPSTYVFDGCG